MSVKVSIISMVSDWILFLISPIKKLWDKRVGKSKRKKEEIENLKEYYNNSKLVELYFGKTFITFKDDEQKIPYCATCWGLIEKRVPIKILENGYFSCTRSECKNSGIYDDKKVAVQNAELDRINNERSNWINYNG